jgi:hypothetical protein
VPAPAVPAVSGLQPSLEFEGECPWQMGLRQTNFEWQKAKRKRQNPSPTHHRGSPLSQRERAVLHRNSRLQMTNGKRRNAKGKTPHPPATAGPPSPKGRGLFSRGIPADDGN